MSELIQFNGQEIRQIEQDGQIYFSVIDVVAVLSNSRNPNDYWYRVKKRDSELSTICRRLKLMAPDGKSRETDCANRQGILRIIQSIPSPNAEPFKRWLAEVGEQRLQEVEDPSLAMDRVRQSFRDLGYPDDWIETRIRTKRGRLELTAEWQKRGIHKQREYAELTAILSGAAFGVIPSDHKQIKGLGKENLRDHMTREELIFTELAELQTKREAIEDDVQGLEENKEAARKGGVAAGKAREAFEEETGRKVVSSSNFLAQIKAAKKRLLGKNKEDGES